MTDDERLINETLPVIRETMGRWMPFMETSGYMSHMRQRTLRQQLDFWLALKWAEEHPMTELTELAREIRKTEDT